MPDETPENPRTCADSPDTTLSTLSTLSTILSLGVLCVIRLPSSTGLVQAAQAVMRGGVRALEITLTVPDALEQLERIAGEIPEALLGVGTVTRPDQVGPAVRAGAKFVVSPVFDPQLIAETHAENALAVTGALTPTEMFRAADAGADLIKLFPAGHLDPSYLKSILAPLPDLKVVPTGGIDETNAGAWIRAGAVAVGAGGSLMDPSLFSAGNFAEIEARARALVEAIRGARAQLEERSKS